MRKVFAVGGRSRDECGSSSSRKRGRSSRRWEEQPDDLLWEEEDEDPDFMPDPGRSVSWGANGLTIRARNAFPDATRDTERMPPPKRSRECEGFRPSGRRYDLWGSVDDVFQVDHEYNRARAPRQDRDDDPPPRSSYRHSFPDVDRRRHEPRGYEHVDGNGKRGDWQRDASRCRAVRERSWEISYSLRLSPPPPPRSRDRFDHVEREQSVRRLSPPRVRCEDFDHRSRQHDSRRREEYSRGPETKPPRSEDRDLPPGFVSHNMMPDGPRASSRADFDPRTCFRCGKVGHLSANCSSKGERSPRCPRGKQCYTCGDYGHMSYDCPSKSANGEKDITRSLRRCYNCYETGHLVHECPMSQDVEPRNETVQEDDSVNVLYTTKLTETEKNQYLRENRCFTCRKLGHPYYSCPQSEKRLEYVFNDRENKSSWKLLRNPCWKYVDNHGEVRGPVSLSSLATGVEEGFLHRDFQAHHMYNGNMQPISVRKLIRIAKSEPLVAILSCMPEAASFLGEEMDAENCKANALTVLQTKIHYDIFETTVRWIVISSMNEALQDYRNAKRQWRNRPPTAENYLEPDKSGPPHSSDRELSPPDGKRDGAGHSTNTMMLVECQTFASDSSLEDPKSIAVEAIQKSIHSRVLGAVRTGILDATTAKCLDSRSQPRKSEVAEVISEDHSGDSNSKGTNESSPSPVETSKILDLNHTSKQQEQKSDRRKQQDVEQKSFEQELKFSEKQRQQNEQQNEQQRELKSKLSDQQTQHKPRELSQQKQEVKSSERQKQRDSTSKEQYRQQKKQESEQHLKSTEQKQQDLNSFEEQQHQHKQDRKPSVLQQPQKHLKEKTSSEQQEEPVQTSSDEQQVANPVEGAADLDSFMRCSGEREKQEKAPELVLRIFRKKKSVAPEPIESQLDDNSRPAKKRVLKLCDLSDAKGSNPEPSSLCAKKPHVLAVKEEVEAIQDEVKECLAPSQMEMEEVSDDGSEPVAKTQDEKQKDSISLRKSCPQSSGCARSSISGWEWRGWSRRYKFLETEVNKELEISSSPVKAVRPTRPSRSSRCTRAQARKLSNVSDAQRRLKARKKHLKLERSNIHSWGVVTMEPIEAEDFVVEYVGELVRPKVADLRESRYQKQEVGCSYFFRVGDEYVIDATVRGNQARFINHSCEPNCYTKVITIDGRKRVFIYARKFIPVGTELTYDYKFPRENEKLPCFCGTWKCRGFLN